VTQCARIVIEGAVGPADCVSWAAERSMDGLSLMSNIPDATQSAQVGIARGISRLNEDVKVVAQSVTGSGGDPTAALVDSLQEKLAVEASVRVMAVSDQMLGTLVDVMA
jgi:hypothetical protein